MLKHLAVRHLTTSQRGVDVSSHARQAIHAHSSYFCCCCHGAMASCAHARLQMQRVLSMTNVGTTYLPSDEPLSVKLSMLST